MQAANNGVLGPAHVWQYGKMEWMSTAGCTISGLVEVQMFLSF